MSSISPKKMLEELLQTATLTAKERDAFEGMWDAIHRYGHLSRKQTGWIEEVYYKKDLTKAIRPAPKRSPKLGFITDPTATKVVRMRSLDSVRMLCPNINSESAQFKAIAEFFKSGGEVFEVRPKQCSSVPLETAKS